MERAAEVVERISPKRSHSGSAVRVASDGAAGAADDVTERAQRPRDWLRASVGLSLGATLFVLTLFLAPRTLESWLNAAVAVTTCFVVALSDRYPIAGACVETVALAMVWLTPDITVSLSSMSMFLVTSMVIWPGRYVVIFVATPWYLTSVVAVNATSAAGQEELVKGTLVWLAFEMILVLIGELLLRQRMANVKLEEKRRAELAAQRRAIARELHDTAVYSATMVVMRAEAAKLRKGVDPQLAEDLEFIARIGHATTADLRHVLEPLRATNSLDPAFEADVATRLTIRDRPPAGVIGEQIGEVKAVGLKVHAAVDGGVSRLPEVAAATFSHIVTEACSNIVKHASHCGPVMIMVEVGVYAVDATFINIVPSPDGGLDALSGFLTDRSDVKVKHFGLAGQQERIEALGGVIRVSQVSDRWIVRVSIPLHG